MCPLPMCPRMKVLRPYDPGPQEGGELLTETWVTQLDPGTAILYAQPPNPTFLQL
jgi:hypothetical protein